MTNEKMWRTLLSLDFVISEKRFKGSSGSSWATVKDSLWQKSLCPQRLELCEWQWTGWGPGGKPLRAEMVSVLHHTHVHTHTHVQSFLYNVHRVIERYARACSNSRTFSGAVLECVQQAQRRKRKMDTEAINTRMSFWVTLQTSYIKDTIISSCRSNTHLIARCGEQDGT